jgi:hypothetical protein
MNPNDPQEIQNILSGYWAVVSVRFKETMFVHRLIISLLLINIAISGVLIFKVGNVYVEASDASSYALSAVTNAEEASSNADDARRRAEEATQAANEAAESCNSTRSRY